jgi:hypothetical protein
LYEKEGEMEKELKNIIDRLAELEALRKTAKQTAEEIAKQDNIILEIHNRLDRLEQIVIDREERMKQAYLNFEEKLKLINDAYKLETATKQ